MSMEQAMLTRACPQVLTNRTHTALAVELSKGCRREFRLQPVDLEPPYCPSGAADADDMPWVAQVPVSRDGLAQRKPQSAVKRKVSPRSLVSVR